MTNIQILLTTAINSLVQYLMCDYQVTYDWAMRTVLGSATYKRLIDSISFRNEGTLYIYNQLLKELRDNHIIDG